MAYGCLYCYKMSNMKNGQERLQTPLPVVAYLFCISPQPPRLVPFQEK